MLGPAAKMASSKPKLLPHQLVARDARSSYIQRVQTLAGPGAYVIPSCFTQAQLNDKLRDVQQLQYGREFARKQRQQPPPADARLDLNTDQRSVANDTKYRARRDHLRAMLQRMVRLFVAHVPICLYVPF